MAKVKTKNCPNCSAILPPAATGQVVCEYCGAHIEVEPPSPPPPVQRPPELRLPIQMGVPRPPKFVWLVVLLPMILIGVGVIVAISASKKAAQSRRGDPAGGHSPKGEAIRWDDDGQIAMARINGDAVDDLMGRYWLYEQEKNNIYLGAFDGATFERLWKAGPFGDVSTNNAHMYTFFAVTASRVAVSDYASMVHILDRATGAEQRSVRLSDRVQKACASPDSADQVWLEVADQHHVLLDLATGDTTDAARPDWCPGTVELSSGSSACWRAEFLRNRRGRATCFGPEELGKSQGFQPEYALASEPHVVALGHKEPGSRLPMIAGYADGKPIWVRNLVGDPQATPADGTPQLADLAFGHLIVHYQVDQKWHLTSIDPASGAARWDVLVPNTTWSDSSDNLLVTEDRVFLPTRSYLHVFDLATGRLHGTIGRAY